MVSPERHSEAMEKINVLVGVRERTAKEVRERLAKCGFTSEEVEDAVETALRVNLINEERYARAFIRGKTHSGWGRVKITARLAANGVDEEIIASCADEFSSTQDEYEVAMAELSKRAANSKNPYATYMRRLVGRGFSYELSTRVVRDFLAMQS